MSVIDERKADKRRRILRAALELFAERGFHGTAVPDVAERAEVGPGTIYRFVASKEELVNVLFRETKARLGQALMHGDDPSQDPRARFLALWDRLYAFAESDPVAVHFLELQDHAPYLDPTSRAVEHGVLLPIVEAVIAMQARGVLRTDLRPDVLIAFAWGGFVGLLKAERAGYLRLDAELVRSAALVWWRSVARESGEPAPLQTPTKPTNSKSTSAKPTSSKSTSAKPTKPKSTSAKLAKPKSVKLSKPTRSPRSPRARSSRSPRA
ncbi:MAG: TetR/AcrR family transcriptional regulator, partial [Myxococcota bacterium]|jgi:AcrR family transcriptional regulator|nr:TetR/AcrR family transcriptional regulator [Myxococcota bacterium]